MTNYYENAQARIISNLTEHIKELKEEIKKRDSAMLSIVKPAYYYQTLQKIILDNPILQDDWTKFLTLIKLACDKEELDKLSHLNGLPEDIISNGGPFYVEKLK